MRVDDTRVPSSSEGFISLMDNATFSVTHKSTPLREPQKSPRSDDEEDLGFGNTTKLSEDETKKPSQQPEPTQVTDPDGPGRSYF
jgi:hypothetical protein